MTNDIFTESDLEQMKQLGITEKEVRRQLAIFEKGPRRLSLGRPCTLSDGIVLLETLDQEHAHAAYLGYFNLVLSLNRLLDPDTEFVDLNDRITAALARRVTPRTPRPGRARPRPPTCPDRRGRRRPPTPA